MRPHPLAIALSGLLVASSGCANQSSKAPAADPKPPTQSPAAKSQEDLKARVEALLSGYEFVPSEEHFKPLGPQALTVLEQIFNDPSALPTRRNNAVAAMALVDNPAAESKLRAIVTDPKIDLQLRSTAAMALAHRTGEKALPDLLPLLDAEEPRLRDAAARAVGSVGTPGAKKALEDRLGKEEDPSVREAIQQTLTKMEP